MQLEGWTQTPGCGSVAEGFTTLCLSFLICNVGTEAGPPPRARTSLGVSPSGWGLCTVGPQCMSTMLLLVRVPGDRGMQVDGQFLGLPGLTGLGVDN